MTRQEISTLKLGDEVAWKRGYDWEIAKIVSIGTRSFTTSDGSRWGRRSGRLYGSEYTFVAKVTQEHRDAVEKRNLSVRLRYRIQWDDLDLDTMRKVIAVVDPLRSS